MPKAFPARIPLEKPTDRDLSAAMHRLYDVWNPYEDRGNEFFSNFKYTPLTGLEERPGVSRRDPSKVLRIDGKYYVWYTCRRTNSPPVGHETATDAIPSRDWDLADIWYATSDDGFHWEEQGPAAIRPPKGVPGWRSLSTPDVLVWKGKYHLYYQQFSSIITGADSCPVSRAWAESPDGPWHRLDRPVIDNGAPDEWDAGCIHDPFPLVYRGRIHLYYKGSPGAERGGDNIIRAQGVAIADDPAGPFEKSPLNPISNSGHETCLWPYREGIAALFSLDGPEKNTVQYAPDGLNFEVQALVTMPPIAPGPFVPDAFADSGDGRGITWGLCHLGPGPGGGTNESILARFDCDLSRDGEKEWPFKANNQRYDARTFFQGVNALPEALKKRRRQGSLDRDTII